MEADSSETVLPTYQTTRRHAPQDQNLGYNITASTSNLMRIKLAHVVPEASSSEHGNYSSGFIKDEKRL